MARIVWNVLQNCEVPFNPNLDVDGNPNLEYRGVNEPASKGEVPAVEGAHEVPAVAAKVVAPKKSAPRKSAVKKPAPQRAKE